MSLYIILTGWAGLGIQVRPDTLRIRLGWLVICAMSHDIEEMLVAHVDKMQQAGEVVIQTFKILHEQGPLEFDELLAELDRKGMTIKVNTLTENGHARQ